MEYLLPHSKETECATLGCMLLDNEALVLATEKLEADDFYIEKNRVIFSAMQDLFERDIAVDLVTLIDQLDKTGGLVGVGGQEYIILLGQSVPTTSNISQYIQILKEKSMLRKLASIGKGLSKEAGNEEFEADIVLNKAEQEIFNISVDKKSSTLEHINEALNTSYNELLEATTRKGELLGLATGFKELDRMTLGMQPSQLIVIAGRPGMGKTSFALNIASNVALKQKGIVAIFSLEMGKEQLVKRIICSEAMVDLKKASDGTLSEDEFEKINEAVKILSSSQIYIDDTAGVSVMSIRSKCRRLKIKSGLSLIVIDYLQLMQGRGKAENRQLEISDMTRSLKNMARELEVPILLLSQLGRGPENRADHRPMISDLRESGSIEQDADNVLLLYRDKVYNKDANDLTEIIVAKQRSGPTGTINVSWRGELTKFLCLDGKR